MRTFYSDVLHALEYPGDDRSKFFDARCGLCVNLALWVDHRDDLIHPYDKISARYYLPLKLSSEFAAAGLHAVYPFTDGLLSAYRVEIDSQAIWENPLRLKWVRDHAA